MIDYQKVKTAHELFQKYLEIPGANESYMYISFNLHGLEAVYGLQPAGQFYVGHDNIDDLIEELKRLTHQQKK